MIKLGADEGNVSKSLRQVILDAKNLYVTPIARAEIGIKLSIGKLRLPVMEADYWTGITSRLQAKEVPFDSTHAALLCALPLIHRDPFDRMIAAQCIAEGLLLATTDSIFTEYGVMVAG